MNCLRNKTPGPGYKLGTTVGYIGHDLAHYRNPAYSMGMKDYRTGKSLVPGPYKVENCDKNGPYQKLGYSFGMKGKGGAPPVGPGPANYSLGRKIGGPAYSFGMKPRASNKSTGPSAADYFPQLYRQGGFTIAGRRAGVKPFIPPGPGPATRLQVYKTSAPAYSLGLKPPSKVTSVGPGPSAYLPKFCDCSPRTNAWSFGMRHDACSPPMITAQDVV